VVVYSTEFLRLSVMRVSYKKDFIKSGMYFGD
jgi:hypothetical protein